MPWQWVSYAEIFAALPEITDTTHEEKGCTEQCSGLILLNGEEHHGDQGLLLHTLFHEIGHVLMYGAGIYHEKEHERLHERLDCFAGLATQLYLSARWRE